MTIECFFLGTLGRDAERKTSQSGKTYLRLNVRVGDGDGAQWVSVLSFDQKAIEIADHFIAGSRIYAEGKLSAKEWIGKDGEKRLGLSVLSFHTRLAQIGRQKVKRDTDNPNASVAGGYVSPRSAPANRLPGNDFNNDPGF